MKEFQFLPNAGEKPRAVLFRLGPNATVEFVKSIDSDGNVGDTTHEISEAFDTEPLIDRCNADGKFHVVAVANVHVWHLLTYNGPPPPAETLSHYASPFAHMGVSIAERLRQMHDEFSGKREQHVCLSPAAVGAQWVALAVSDVDWSLMAAEHPGSIDAVIEDIFTIAGDLIIGIAQENLEETMEMVRRMKNITEPEQNETFADPSDVDEEEPIDALPDPDEVDEDWDDE